MPPAVKVDCPKCGRGNPPDIYTCQMCGYLLSRAYEDAGGPGSLMGDVGAPTVKRRRRAGRGVAHVYQRRGALPGAWAFFGLGLLALPAFFLVPMVASMGWHLGAIVHELGHTLAGWATGCPSIPRIFPGAAADTLIGEQVTFLVLAIMALICTLGWTAYKRDAGSSVLIAIGIVAIGFPLVAFTGLKELLFSVSGHVAELTFGVIALWRAYTGGFTSSPVERGLYSIVGWYLVGSNVGLAWGLVFSASARADYLAGSPCGWANDYVRLANDVGVSLTAVAGLMGLVALASIPISLWLTRFARAVD